MPALNRAWDTAEAYGEAEQPRLVQVPHHGSRRNCSSAWVDRAIGLIGGLGGNAIVSVVAKSDDHPSGRVVNFYARRGYAATAGRTLLEQHGGAARPGWVAVDPLGPMDESGED